jgi:hypothetical protein
MLDIGFAVKEISDFCAVSESTIYRRMMCYGLRKYSFSHVSDEVLTEIVIKLVKQFPRCGEKMLRELLRQKNIHVSFRLCLCMLCRTDTWINDNYVLTLLLSNILG